MGRARRTTAAYAPPEYIAHLVAFAADRHHPDPAAFAATHAPILWRLRKSGLHIADSWGAQDSIGAWAANHPQRDHG